MSLPCFFFFFFKKKEEEVIHLDNQGPVKQVEKKYQRKMPAADEDTNDEGSDDEVTRIFFLFKKIFV